ncbi:MAG TPA: apolipoprotein N-acyltransferase [Sedimenticola sp.]|nr:apolipoprotein N-acyltransferase [Sedimenticola sp.]
MSSRNPFRRLIRFPQIASLCAGALATLAFAPFALSPVSILSLALLLWLWRDATPGQAFQRGWLFGLGLMGFGVFWLHISIDQFGNIGLPLAVVITLVFVAAMALYYGLAGWLGARLAPPGGGGDGLRLLLIYPAVWVLAEWVRGWFLTGFPWLALGYSQIDTALQGFAPLLGVYGLSWIAALCAGLLVLVLISFPFSSKARANPDTLPACDRTLLLLGGLAAIWVSGGLLEAHGWTRAAGKPLRVSMIQGNIPQERKWLPEQFGPTLELYTGLTRANWDSDLVIWPETAVPAFYSRVDEGLLTPLEAEARSRDTDLLLGLAMRGPGGGRYFNAMISLGRQRDAYFKRHLVPFGEFLPLKGLLGPLIDFLQIPMSDFSAGPQDKVLLRLAGYPAGISICYEDAFGEEVIQALPQAAFLVNASNDAWFGDSLAPHQHLEIARMRALETGRYLLRSTNTGVSAVIGPRGEVLGVSPAFRQDVLTRDIIPMEGMTPYARMGNRAIVSIALAMLGLAFLWGRRSQG